MKSLAIAAIVSGALATFAVFFAAGGARPGRGPALTEVHAALDRGDHARAILAWPDAYGAALATGAWQPLLAGGDAALRIGDATASRSAASAQARLLYQHAFFRARAQRSVSGMVEAAERFAALGDREVAARLLADARRLAARDAPDVLRIDAVASPRR